jgi:hypothetical protein
MVALPRDQERELIDLYHAANVALSGEPASVTRWGRLLYALTEFCVRHPEVAAYRAYKALDQLTKHQPIGGDYVSRR